MPRGRAEAPPLVGGGQARIPVGAAGRWGGLVAPAADRAGLAQARDQPDPNRPAPG